MTFKNVFVPGTMRSYENKMVNERNKAPAYMGSHSMRRRTRNKSLSTYMGVTVCGQGTVENQQDVLTATMPGEL